MSFTYWLGVDQSFCLRRKISLRDGAVIGYLKAVASESWVKRFEGDWMWMASDKLAEQLPMICTSDRTVERIWSSLRLSGVVETKIIGNRQCFKFTEIADEWNKQVPPQVAGQSKKVSPKVAAAPARSGGASVATNGGEVSPKVATNKSTTKISNTNDNKTNKSDAPKPAHLLKPDKQKSPGLHRFRREVNYTGQLAACGPKTLEAVWQEIDGEQYADTIIENINLHLDADTWKSKDDYRTPINHVLANLLWLHPPEQSKPDEQTIAEKTRQERLARQAASRANGELT